MVRTSIIVPVFNTGKYLKDCFRSIFNQTQKEIEVIAVNDGSTDDSLHILEEIKERHPEMIIFSQENQGLGSARNMGMELATGEFIYFLDSDDCLVDIAMETCYKHAKENRVDVVMFDAEIFGDIEGKNNTYDRTDIIADKEKVLSGEEFACKYWLKKFYPNAYLVYMSSRFIKESNLKFLPGVYYEDNIFHFKMMPLAKRVMYIPKKLYRRRYREESIMTAPYSIRHANDYLQMIQTINMEYSSVRLQSVTQELEKQFINSLFWRCNSNDIFKNYEFAQEFYKTALDIYGDMEDINSYSDINTLCQYMEVLSRNMIFSKAKQLIERRKKEIVAELFEGIPLKLSNIFVGIYGTGKDAERFLNVYQNNLGDIKAKLIFIDSNLKSGEKKFMNENIYNIRDIAIMTVECIVVASSKFEREICHTIKELYGNRYRIIRLRTDLHF